MKIEDNTVCVVCDSECPPGDVLCDWCELLYQAGGLSDGDWPTVKPIKYRIAATVACYCAAAALELTIAGAIIWFLYQAGCYLMTL